MNHLLRRAITCSFLCALALFGSSKALAQVCTTGTVYAVLSTNQQELYRLDPATDAGTLVVNLFSAGVASTDGGKQTSAFALQSPTNTIWFASRGAGTDIVPHIYSYNINTGVHGTARANFAGVTGISNINKSAYNPVDRRVYFHNASTNTIYRFDPATPTVDAVNLGPLVVPGAASPGGFAGGDLAFDGLGNLTGAFNNANILALFPAQYNADGTYAGLSLTGQKFADLTQTPASVAFLPDGNYISGGTTGSSIINTETGVNTDISATNNFGSSDFASCAAPSPNLVVTKTASTSCAGATTGAIIQYTITVQNTGQFVAVNSRLIDALPAGVTLTSATLNGNPIAGASNATLAAGIPINSSSVPTAGQIERGETATIILTATAASGTYSNQAFVKYNGVESLNLPNDQVPSDNPATGATNDATSVTTTACFSISGNVFNDLNGLTDGNVNGTGTNAGGLFAVLLDGSGNVLASVPIAANGTYSFPSYPAGNYSIRVSTTSGGAVSLPAGWVSTGEDCCDNVGSDGTVNGSTPVTVGNANVANVNFGIEQPPIATNDQSLNNPSGTPVTINPLTNDSDPNGGTLDATSVSLVPPAGVTGVITDPQGDVTGFTVPNEGTWSVNPTTGAVTFTPQPGFTGNPTDIQYTVEDNAGIKSNPALIDITYAAPVLTTLSGTVLNDNNGQTGGVNGNPLPGATVTLFAADGTTVLATTTTDANGNYSFPNLPPSNYVVAVTPPGGFSNVSSADGVTPTDGRSSVTVGATPVTGVNFGLNQPPTAVANSVSGLTPGAVATLPSILSNDSDPNGGTLDPANISLVAPAGTTGVTTDPQGDVTGFTVPGQGTWAIDPAGNATFTPQAGFTGDPSPINYTVRDAAGLISNPAPLSADYNQPQPVKLVAFTGKEVENEVKLAWSTSEEINSSHYLVEHSLSAESWREVGKVAAKGKSWSLAGYSFSDANPASGTNYYRLKMVDLDGTYAYSQIISVNVRQGEKVAVWPNPASSLLKVSGVNGKVVKIYSSTGVLQVETRVEQGQIDISRLPGGVYILHVVRDGVPFTQKFVVSH